MVENADDSGGESGSSDDEVSVESFGADASNWDGSSYEDSDHSNSDVSQRLIIDEVPETQPEDANVNRPILPDDASIVIPESQVSVHNASTSVAPAANHHPGKSKRSHFSTSTSDDDVAGDTKYDPDWVPHLSKKHWKKSKKSDGLLF